MPIPTPVVLGAGLIGLWLASHVLEALRPAPKVPATLRCAPEIPIEYVQVNG